MIDARHMTVRLCGEDVVVRPYRYFDLERLLQGDGSLTGVQAFAAAVRMPPEEFMARYSEMTADEAAALLGAIEELNADFFARAQKQKR